MLCVVDEFTREALAIRVARRLTSSDVIDTLADLFLRHGTPAHIRSDQGPEFVAEAVKGWIGGVGSKTAYIEKASPWENGYVESFMYGRPPRCKGELTLGGGRVRSCIRPVCAAS
jgi:transposase InsO family protein